MNASIYYSPLPTRVLVMAALTTVLGALVCWILFGPPDDGEK